MLLRAAIAAAVDADRPARRRGGQAGPLRGLLGLRRLRAVPGDLARTALKIEAAVTPDQLYAPGLMAS